MDENICFSNFSLSSSTYYFFYIGELKAHGLTDYLKAALAHGKLVLIFKLSIPRNYFWSFSCNPRRHAVS